MCTLPLRASAAPDARPASSQLAGLRDALPCHFRSCVAVRVDSGCADLLRALVLGAEGTPYAGGAFLFDILLPAAYPSCAPQVRFLTTGGGAWRANPNLYNNGTVCLSLLGTWSGPGWEPGRSSLLQLLVSLQGLVLIERPYYNEPGCVARGAVSTRAHHRRC